MRRTKVRPHTSRCRAHLAVLVTGLPTSLCELLSSTRERQGGAWCSGVQKVQTSKRIDYEVHTAHRLNITDSCCVDEILRTFSSVVGGGCQKVQEPKSLLLLKTLVKGSGEGKQHRCHPRPRTTMMAMQNPTHHPKRFKGETSKEQEIPKSFREETSKEQTLQITSVKWHCCESGANTAASSEPLCEIATPHEIQTGIPRTFPAGLRSEKPTGRKTRKRPRRVTGILRTFPTAQNITQGIRRTFPMNRSQGILSRTFPMYKAHGILRTFPLHIPTSHFTTPCT
jgi:hypothetical protein